MAKYDKMMDWLAGLYVNVLNLIQYMHDKYYYEASQMALIDTGRIASSFSYWIELVSIEICEA